MRLAQFLDGLLERGALLPQFGRAPRDFVLEFLAVRGFREQRLRQRALRFLEFRDVRGGARRAHDAAGVVAERRGIDQQGDPAAVGQLPLGFVPSDGFAREHAFDRDLVRFAIAAVTQLDEFRAEKRLGRAAEHVHDRLVEEGQPALAVDAPHDVVRRLDEVAILRLAPPQFLGGMLARLHLERERLAHVFHRMGHLVHLAVRRDHGGHRRELHARDASALRHERLERTAHLRADLRGDEHGKRERDEPHRDHEHDLLRGRRHQVRLGHEDARPEALFGREIELPEVRPPRPPAASESERVEFGLL